MEHSFRSVEDYRKKAEEKLSPVTFGYYASGARGLSIPDLNCKAFKRWKFRPRLMRDVSKVDTSTSVTGHDIPYPICVAPTANHTFAYPDGEVATAQGANNAGTGMVLSIFSIKSMEDVSKTVPTLLRWCHLQFIQDRKFMEHYVRRAEKNGFSGFVVTLDQTVVAKRHFETRMGTPVLTWPSRPRRGNLENTMGPLKPEVGYDIDYQYRFGGNLNGTQTWDDLKWLKLTTKLPIIVKGILTAEMALQAIENKVDGIIVSNHGRRQLEDVFATIDVLPKVVKAVNGRCDVYMDGGIRTGADVAKAIALGAKAVFLGRPALWGLAVNGSEGVKDVLHMLRDELVATMRLIGVKSLNELQTTPNLVVHESYFKPKL